MYLSRQSGILFSYDELIRSNHLRTLFSPILFTNMSQFEQLKKKTNFLLIQNTTNRLNYTLAGMTLWPETLWPRHFGQNDTLARETIWPETLWPERHFGQ